MKDRSDDPSHHVWNDNDAATAWQCEAPECVVSSGNPGQWAAGATDENVLNELTAPHHQNYISYERFTKEINKQKVMKAVNNLTKSWFRSEIWFCDRASAHRINL